jgi:hypothetical protein
VSSKASKGSPVSLDALDKLSAVSFATSSSFESKYFGASTRSRAAVAAGSLAAKLTSTERGLGIRAAGRIISREGIGLDGMESLGKVKEDGEEGAMVRRFLGESGNGVFSGIAHTLRMELLIGVRRGMENRAMLLGTRTLGESVERKAELPRIATAGEVRIISDASMSFDSLVVDRALLMPVNAQGEIIDDIGSGEPGEASTSHIVTQTRIESTMRAPPPRSTNIAARIRAACRLTRDGLRLHLPQAFPLAQAVGELPFEGKDRAIEVHYTNPTIQGEIRIPNVVPGPLGVHVRLGWPPPAARDRSTMMTRSYIPDCTDLSLTIARCGPDKQGAVYLPLAAQTTVVDGIVR